MVTLSPKNSIWMHFCALVSEPTLVWSVCAQFFTHLQLKTNSSFCGQTEEVGMLFTVLMKPNNILAQLNNLEMKAIQ